MNLFQILMRPDKEEQEHGERVLVAKAANLLQVGEFQLLQLAYRDWHDKDLPEALVSKLFSSYMLRDEVPHWARHYARKILDADAKGTLNDNAPSFHAYDHDYRTSVPGGVQRFWGAVTVLAVVMVGAVVLSDLSIARTGASSQFPPYLDQEDLKESPAGAAFGRADALPASHKVNSSLPDMGDAMPIGKPTGMLPAPP